MIGVDISIPAEQEQRTNGEQGISDLFLDASCTPEFSQLSNAQQGITVSIITIMEKAVAKNFILLKYKAKFKLKSILLINI